jgi:hypothetical protein
LFFPQLNPGIVVACIDQLLKEGDEASVECMCKLLTTGGKQLYHNVQEQFAKLKEKEQFDKLVELTKTSGLPKRIIFMIKDVIDLRNSGWNARMDKAGPKTIEEVRKDAAAAQAAPAVPAARPSVGGGGNTTTNTATNTTATTTTAAASTTAASTGSGEAGAAGGRNASRGGAPPARPSAGSGGNKARMMK